MFGRSHRLDLRHTPNFFKQAQRLFTQDLTWFVVPSKDLKVALRVPKKGFPTSVQRHRVKRVLLQALRQILEDGAVTGQFLIMVKPSLAGKSSSLAEVQPRVLSSWRQVVLKIKK